MSFKAGKKSNDITFSWYEKWCSYTFRKGELMMAKLQSISEGLTILNHSDNIVKDVCKIIDFK